MTPEERTNFNNLTKDRAESADTFDKPSMRGARDNVVDKYSDQAHFIYELLQNADDVGAREAFFELKRDELVFYHNGNKHFSVSNPYSVEEDKINGRLGDINAICSVGQSNKGNDATIGKFGVGFKAVFQYTATPRIYDRDFQFKIERLFVPRLIQDDEQIHKDKRYTYFVFPFDKKEVTPKFAFSDISEKLESLTYPLLFLNNLNAIMCEYNGKSVIYDKKIKKTKVFGDTVAELVTMSVTIADKTVKSSLWLFSRKLGRVLKYSIGYFLDENGMIKKVERGAFCYFPTKEYTGLSFIVHAPFLLTSSRETVKAGEPHNVDMVDKLSDLAADSIIYLRDIGLEERKLLVNDDFFLNILPRPKKSYSYAWDEVESNRDKLSFEPFAEKMKECVKNQVVLPCSNGKSYVSAENAYWVRTPKMAETFDDEKLVVLTNNENARWIFQPKNNFNDQQNTNRDFYDYINDIIGRKHRFEDADILKNNDNLTKLITLENVEWLHDLYSYGNQTRENRDNSKFASIFLDECGDPTPLFEKKGNNITEILFLPSEIKTLKSIHPAILTNAESKKFVLDLGITEPSKVDQVKDGILKKYANDDSYGLLEDFDKIFKVYNEAEIEDQYSLIEAIKNNKYKIAASDVANEDYLYVLPDKTYFRTELLEQYFSYSKDYIFVDDQILNGKRRDKEAFLERLGSKRSPAVITHNFYSYFDVRDIKKIWGNHNNNRWEEKHLEGVDENLQAITKDNNKERSLLLWKILLNTIKNYNGMPLESVLTGNYYWLSARHWKLECSFESRCLTRLRNTEWLCTVDGQFLAPSKITVDALTNDYDISTVEAKILIKSLQIGDARFNDDEMKQIRFASEITRMGFSFEQILEYARSVKDKQMQLDSHKDNASSTAKDKGDSHEKDGQKEQVTINSSVDLGDISPSYKDVYKQIEKERKKLDEKNLKDQDEEIGEQSSEDIQEDEIFQPSENTTKKIEKKQQEIAEEINRIEREQRLTENIAHFEKYSYGWMTNLIEKELLLTEQYEGTKKSLKALFTAVEKESGTSRTLILKNPIGGIPQDIENHNDIPMTFVFNNGDTKDIVVDAFNINSYTVRAKIKNADQIDGIILSDVREISIKLEKAGFLLEELNARYKEFKYDSTFSMRDNLTKDIDFVFGPPGTGKTTYLCKDVIIPIMNQCYEKKILVLGPTNKSADVIINKIVDLCGDDLTYEDWLVRFGSTQDESIDVLPVYKDKHVDMDDYGDCTVVTTIHRFWYDFMIPSTGQGVPLRDIEWDYIIIDEASMIPLVHILYPLYRKNPEKFIIAGDPFQIEPVITCEEWKDENIYTMIRLNEFKSSPNTIPHKYDIKLLTTQYRSIPSIGKVFSNLTYNGVLKHNRKETDKKSIDFGDESYNNINLIRYPVSKYESIYASKYLDRKSAYHVYSALLCYEFANHLSESINVNGNDHVSIGIISPYRAQADIIEKMCRNIKKSDKVSIQVGTIHGFQGDECDIVICMFNAPPGELTSKKLSINKCNIINVAISRARDYLFIVCPEEESRGFGNLSIINKMISIIRSNGSYKEISSHTLEQSIFNNSNYLEQSTFSTSHQNVNVYELPEKKYEIRAEESALDIQVHTIDKLSDIRVANPAFEEVKRVENEAPMNNKVDVSKTAIESKSKKKEFEYSSDQYHLHLYLMKDVKQIFNDRKKYSLIEGFENSFKMNMNNAELFRLENNVKQKRAIIYAKTKVLGAVEFENRFVYYYKKKTKEFWFAVEYEKLPSTLLSLSKIDKKASISDDELIVKIHAIKD